MKRSTLTILTIVIILCLCSSTVLAKEKEITVTATASSVYSANYAVQRAIDNDYNTYWLGAYMASPWWITFDAGNAVSVGKLKLTWYSDYYAPSSYDIQISDDGITWEDVYTNIAGIFAIEGTDRDIQREARYIRLYINSAYNYAVLREFKAYQDVDYPRTIRFQGTLDDSSGAPIDGFFTLTFRLYNSETGGESIWEEMQQSINIVNGLVDVELGSVTPLDVSFQEQYWLSVEVESDGEMLPRFKLTSVPYAITTEQ